MKKNLQRHAIAQPKAEHEAAEQQPPQPTGYKSLPFDRVHHLADVPNYRVLAFALYKEPLAWQPYNLYPHPVLFYRDRVVQPHRIPPQQGIGNDPLNSYRIPHLHRISQYPALVQHPCASLRGVTGSQQQGNHCQPCVCNVCAAAFIVFHI
jgi:hypothetical protein